MCAVPRLYQYLEAWLQARVVVLYFERPTALLHHAELPGDQGKAVPSPIRLPALNAAWYGFTCPPASIT